MIELPDWPALSLDSPLDEGDIRYERGVWGKVHGAASDFRWIARSAGFGQRVRGLEHHFAAGTEDRPARAAFWRTPGNGCHYAVATYPSRARDVTGRMGFLEKQVLEWRRPPEVPAALGALLLLSFAAGLTDQVWWEHCSDPRWEEADFSLAIEEQHRRPLPVSAAELAYAIEEGREALRERLDEAALGRLYARILARRRPALLPGLAEPLPPAALAALLLPLPRGLADGLSLAGWIPASRGSLDELGQLWEVIVPPPDLSLGSPAGEIDPAHEDEGHAMARRLLARGTAAVRSPASPPPVAEELVVRPAARAAAPADPPPPRPPARRLPLRPGLLLELPPPGPNPPDLLAALYDFAASVDCRWLDVEALHRKFPRQLTPLPAESQHSKSLRRWAYEVESQRPAFADERQWQVKVDLLRSAALCLTPDPVTFAAVGLPESGHVPGLLFAVFLTKPEPLWYLGKENLRRTIRQSLDCDADGLVKRVDRLLRTWHQQTSGEQRKLLEEALTAAQGTD